MATASDNFDRSDENPLAGNWTTITNASAMQISSNNVRSVANDRSGAYYNAQTFTNDHFSEIVLVADGTSNVSGAGCAVRVSSSAQTMYYIYTKITSTTDYGIRLYRCVNGSFASIETYATAVSGGDTIRLSAVGSTISVTQNGVTRISVTDTNIETGQYAGIWSYMNTRYIESWNAGDIGLSATALPRRALDGPFYGSLRGSVR